MDQQRFETLKQKYAPALEAIQQQGVQLQHLHEDNGKLVIVGKAPSDEAKNRVWDKIKQSDPTYKDLTADITIDATMARPSSSGVSATASSSPAQETSTVKAGDSLSKISQQFYGDANQYMKIFEANRDQISDPNKIRPGMQLRVPQRKTA